MESQYKSIQVRVTGNIDTARYTKAVVPDADSWSGSKSFHEYVGSCKDRQRAESDGPLQEH